MATMIAPSVLASIAPHRGPGGWHDLPAESVSGEVNLTTFRLYPGRVPVPHDQLIARWLFATVLQGFEAEAGPVPIRVAGFRRWNANYSHESGFERSGGIVPAWEPRRAELKPLSGVASAEWQKHKPVADVNKTAPVWRVDRIMKSGTKLGRPANRKLR
jgi:hypothetical protein